MVYMKIYLEIILISYEDNNMLAILLRWPRSNIYISYNNLENVQILTFFSLCFYKMPDTQLGSGTYFLEYKEVKDMIFCPHNIWVGDSKQNIADATVIVLE